MTIALIAMVDMADGIGDADGNLLFNIPRDMAHFKNTTNGKKVVMGRKTWDSLPKKPLKNRENFVLTTNKDLKAQGATVINSVEEVLELAKDDEVFVIGGGEVYSQLLPYADKLIMTHVHSFNFEARVFFPYFNSKEWKVNIDKKHEETEMHPSFTFATYTRRTD